MLLLDALLWDVLPRSQLDALMKRTRERARCVGAAMCAEDAVLLADYVTREGDLDDLLVQFEERRKPRVKVVVDASLTMVDWELHPDTPGANAPALMESSLAELTVAA